MRTKAGDEIPQARKRDQHTPNEAKYNLKSDGKVEIIPNTEASSTSADITWRHKILLRDSQMCLDLNHATKIYVERELKTNVVN